MTFKHNKFSDSEVLRSLEKVAISKNLVKQEVITKSANLARDVKPTHNLSQDIIKLCSELRRSGLSKHADDIEGNFINYKRAQTLYEAFKETGEDVVNMAHPDGGHVLKDVEGKPEVMTILERQQAALKMLKKEPTGKLSNAQALRALRLVFGASLSVQVTDEDRKSYAMTFVKNLISILEKALYESGKLRDLKVRTWSNPISGEISKVKENTQIILNNAIKRTKSLSEQNITELELTVIQDKVNKASAVAATTSKPDNEFESVGSHTTCDILKKANDTVTAAKQVLVGNEDTSILPKKYKEAFFNSAEYKYMLSAYDAMKATLNFLHDGIENSSKKPTDSKIAEVKLDCNNELATLEKTKKTVDDTDVSNETKYIAGKAAAKTAGSQIYSDNTEWKNALAAWNIK